MTEPAFTSWAFIYLGTGTEDPAVHRTVIDAGGLTTTVVAVPDRDSAPAVAAALVAEGAQTIELCGAFGPEWVARVLDATGRRVPVGGVLYGVESVPRLATLLGAA